MHCPVNLFCRGRLRPTYLLSNVENHGKVEPLPDGSIPEQGLVRRALREFLLVLDGLADGRHLDLDLLLRLANLAQRRPRALDVAVPLNVPARRLGDPRDQRHDDDGHQRLEDHHGAPVPVAKAGAVLRAGVVGPEADEGSDAVEELPKGLRMAERITCQTSCATRRLFGNGTERTYHDNSTNLSRRHLVDVDGASSYGNSVMY